MSQRQDPKATPDELHQQLGYLNLIFMQQHVEDLASQAALKQWSHVAFLARLVEGEAALRQDRARIRRIQQARFPVLKTLDQFDFTWPAKINRLAVQNLFRLKFIEDKANAVLVGGAGLGKSHLAVALGYAACEAGFRVRFTTAIDIINTLCAADKAGRLVQEMNKYTRPDLLVCDELGYLPIDKRGADLMFQVVAARYERRSTVITTNRLFRDWGKTFDLDNTLATALIDRLMHHGEAVVIEGKSYRL